MDYWNQKKKKKKETSKKASEFILFMSDLNEVCFMIREINVSANGVWYIWRGCGEIKRLTLVL